MIVNETIATDDFTICDEFQNHFISVGSEIPDTISPYPGDSLFGSTLPHPIDVSLHLNVDYRGQDKGYHVRHE